MKAAFQFHAPVTRLGNGPLPHVVLMEGRNVLARGQLVPSSDGASVTADFESPVFLEAGKRYHVHLEPAKDSGKAVVLW